MSRFAPEEITATPTGVIASSIAQVDHLLYSATACQPSCCFVNRAAGRDPTSTVISFPLRSTADFGGSAVPRVGVNTVTIGSPADAVYDPLTVYHFSWPRLV